MLWLMRRRTAAVPNRADSSSLLNSGSSREASSTRAARPRKATVAARSVLGSSRSVAQEEAMARTADKAEAPPTVRAAGSAARSSWSALPGANREASARLVASRPSAAATARPISAAATATRAVRSACQARRRAMRSRLGIWRATARKLILSMVCSWEVKP